MGKKINKLKMKPH